MKELFEKLATGLNGKILSGILALVVFVYVPYLLFYLRKRKTKQEIFESNNRDAIKVYLGLDIIGTLTVYSVNGGEPTFFYEATRQGFFLSPGENKIGVQYHWAKNSPFSMASYINFNIEPREINVYVKKYKTYSLEYRIKQDRYEFNEIDRAIHTIMEQKHDKTGVIS